jgi:hypothetical protein
MRIALVFVAVLAACKTSEKKAGTPSGPSVAASCDYVSQTVGENHSCQEVYAESQVEALERWCAKLQGPRDHGAFAKAKACAAGGRHGGCLYPNGSVTWKYKGDHACIGGLEFDDAPPRKESTPYRCENPRLCTETQSVFDLTKTVTAKNCETGGAKFSAGSCSAENVVARCELHRQDADTTWFFYAPVSAEQAKDTCQQLEGTFAAAPAPVEAGSGSAAADPGSDGSSAK